MFETHKDIPIPQTTRAGFTKKSKYPFATMEVNEMFFVPEAKKSFSSLVTANRKRYNRKFITRRIVVDGVEGIGVWRVE